ncbi:MAG: hypothetical protein O3C34_02710 [Proteobacteria bacterium]|nr:hypothetical protein [Pseudomonadota bacterium]
MSKHTRPIILAAMAASLAWSNAAYAQQPPPQFPDMTFFITSKSGPDGANFGGIQGADNHCKALATRAGAGNKTWRAYLSTQAAGGKPAINARDRIGRGPWLNSAGVQVAANVDELHSAASKINVEIGRSENGRRIPGRQFVVNQHDILTGSTADGRAFPPGKDMTCGNWTKSADGTAQIGHHDRMSGRPGPAGKTWNSAHITRGCSAEKLKSSGGAGLLYCFAAQ